MSASPAAPRRRLIPVLLVVSLLLAACGAPAGGAAGRPTVSATGGEPPMAGAPPPPADAPAGGGPASPPAPPADDRLDIRGTVTSLAPPGAPPTGQGILGAILVEGVLAPDTKHDKAVVTLRDTTRIFEQHGQERRPVSVAALRVGQQVEVRFADGPYLASYPVRAGASEVVILAAGGG